MSAPLYLIAGRLCSTQKAELRVAYTTNALRAEMDNMSDLYALPWARRAEMTSQLAILKWLKPSERRELARRLKKIIDLAHD